MISLQIFDIKEIMEILLIKDNFDAFYFQEAKALTSACLTLSGKRNCDWYDDAEKELMENMPDYLFWREAMLPKEKCTDAGLRQKDADFLLHFRYEKDTLLLVTGCNYHTFALDKSADSLWDDYVKKMLRGWKISFE